MKKASLTLWCALLLAAAVARDLRAEDHCATTPPPEGLVERCRKLEVVVPADLNAFRYVLKEWMRTCVIPDRAVDLVYDNPSVEKAWKLIEGSRDTAFNSYRIIPRYTPLTFTRDGRTCYGVKSVEFVVQGSVSTVTIPSPSPTPPTQRTDFSCDEIKAAAAEGEAALKEFPGPDAYERSHMESVLYWMKKYCTDFDDTYFTVAPDPGLSGTLNPPACYKDFIGGAQKCLPSDNALEACTAHLTPLVVRTHLSGASREAFAELLLATANRINRGLQHLHRIQAQDSQGAVPCQSVSDAIMPAVAAHAKNSLSLYYAWDK